MLLVRENFSNVFLNSSTYSFKVCGIPFRDIPDMHDMHV
jgi:hypothetical protein